MAAACNVVNLIVLGALKAGLLDVKGVEGVERGRSRRLVGGGSQSPVLKSAVIRLGRANI